MEKALRFCLAGRTVAGVKETEYCGGHLIHVLVHIIHVIGQQCLYKIIVTGRGLFEPALDHSAKFFFYLKIGQCQTIYRDMFIICF